MSKVQNVLAPVMVAASIGMAGIAWAVVESNPVTVADNGQPLPNATLTLTISAPMPATETPSEETAVSEPTTEETTAAETTTVTQPTEQTTTTQQTTTPTTTVTEAPQEKTVAAPRVVEQIQVTADNEGRAVVMLDPETIPDGATVDIRIERDGRVITFEGVAFDDVLKQLRSGTFDMNPPLSASPKTATRTPRTPAVSTGPSPRPAVISAEEQPGPGSSGDGFSLTFSPTRGFMDRGRVILPLRLEIGGAITRLFWVDLEDPTGGISAEAALPVPEWGGFRLGFDYLGTSTQYSMPSVATGADTVGFGYPQGGGQFVVGPTTLTNLNYETDYNEWLFRPSFQFPARDWQDIRIQWRLGALYGRTNERSSTDFTVAGTFNFDYSDELNTSRFGAIAGSRVSYPLNDRFDFFTDIELRLIYNKADGFSAVSANAGTCAGGCRNDLSDDRFDVGFRLAAGGEVALNENIDASLTGAFETWQVPVRFYPMDNTGPTAVPASVDWNNRYSFTVNAAVKIKLQNP